MFTRVVAGWCHDCRLCSPSSGDPESGFGRLMEWHRGWCPAWGARMKVYGPEDLTRDHGGRSRHERTRRDSR